MCYRCLPSLSPPPLLLSEPPSPSPPPPLIKILSLSFLRTPFFHLWEQGEGGRRRKRKEGEKKKKDEKAHHTERVAERCGIRRLRGGWRRLSRLITQKYTFIHTHTHTKLAVVPQRHTVPLSWALKRIKCKGNEKEKTRGKDPRCWMFQFDPYLSWCINQTGTDEPVASVTMV